MKTTRFVIHGETYYNTTVPNTPSRGESLDVWGRTVQESLQLARHEYRIWHDGPIEQGKCRKGVFH